MKFPIYLLVCLAAYIQTSSQSTPKKTGPFHWVLNSGLIQCNFNRNLDVNVRGINVYFYDLSKNNQEKFPINKAAKSILSIKNLVKDRKFVIYLGGFTSNIKKRPYEIARKAFKHLPNTYLIMIDHSQYTNNEEGTWQGYRKSVTYVHYIGKALAQMLAALTKGGISPKVMHGVGHSLGGQILGQMGEEFLKLTGRKIARISALDPAGPCFSKSRVENQVRKGVADYVEVYHCDAGVLGSASVLADVDYFVNKGFSQPNCGTPLLPECMDIKSSIKSHQICIDIWMASVPHTNWFPAYKCGSYNKFIRGKCLGNQQTIAGYWNSGNATGVYFFNTKGVFKS